MMEPADLRVEVVKGISVVRLTGEIDLSNAELIRRSILETVSNEDLKVVVDLGDVRYVDSAGIRTFFDLALRLAEHDQELILVLPPDSIIRRSLEVGGVLTTLPIVATIEEATGPRTTQ